MSGWQEAVAWLDDRLAAAGIERTGEADSPRVRPWSTVMRVPTTTGVVWLKAAAPATAFEVALYELLGRVVPDQVLTPIATDAEHGWIALPDGGAPVAHSAPGEQMKAMAAALPQYAELQRALAPHAGELSDLGVADMRPRRLPDRFDEALAAVGPYVDRQADPSYRERLDRVEGLRPRMADWCERLAGAPGAASIDHNDLHPFNVFLAEPGGRARFYDWGDAVLSHPFASMLVVLGFMREHVLATGADDPRLLRLRDAYLEVFSDLAPHAELVETMELARYVAQVARTLIWQRAIEGLDPEEVPDEWASAPFETLCALLENPPGED